MLIPFSFITRFGRTFRVVFREFCEFTVRIFIEEVSGRVLVEVHSVASVTVSEEV